MTDSKSEDTMVAALLREREGLVVRGLKDRIGQVDAQLKLRGYKATPDKSTDDEAATDEAARQEPPKSPKARAGQQQTREGS